MRTATTLVGLTLFALAGTARAQEAAPAADKASAPEADKAAAMEPPPAPAPAPVEAANAAPAEGNVAAKPVPAKAEAEQRKLQLGLNFLPMALGKYTYEKAAVPETEDASFAYGVGLSVVYEVLPGLLVGLAPQLTFNVRPKLEANPARQLDLLARIAYAYRLPGGLSIYAEVLPGYSMIMLKQGSAPKGMVVAFGAGTVMDLTERVFASLGVAYQLGFHNQSLGASTAENRTQYVRVSLGGGVRF